MEKTLCETLPYSENEEKLKFGRSIKTTLLNFYLGQIGRALGLEKLSNYK